MNNIDQNTIDKQGQFMKKHMKIFVEKFCTSVNSRVIINHLVKCIINWEIATQKCPQTEDFIF